MTKNEMRKKIADVLHAPVTDAGYDNTVLWAGGLSLHVNGEHLNPLMSRIYLDTGAVETASARISVEFYFQGITDTNDFPEDLIDARLWLDINDRGFLDEGGVHNEPLLRYAPMRPVREGNGIPPRRGGSLLFTSEDINIFKTGVFNYTVSFSADGLEADDPEKNWVTINEIAHNRDGLIVVSDIKIRNCPSICEICIRKYGAEIRGGKFISGKIQNLTNDIENISTEVIYLLPFFLPGTTDAATGEDVRKGELGSIYAVKDFFKIDPAIAPDPAGPCIAEYVSRGLVTDADVDELLPPFKRDIFPTAASLAEKSATELVSALGGDCLSQIAGRAALRELCEKAHSLGKRVIFDLVVMQTSRDSHLIKEHLDWYCLDEEGAPKRHSIAWLDYSDVALFDLSFNRPLQNYIGGVAPYWIERCGFDGVRIDASQTVDRPFLKQLKNRINSAKPDAIVLGETLCPMEQALDVPTDMIYTLLVDHHVNAASATSFFDIFEQTHGIYEKGTVGIAYFENHDSARATAEWHKRFCALIESDASLREYWTAQAANALNKQQLESDWDLAYFPALLKNIMSSLINCTAGTRDAVMFSYAIEAGTDYGEESRTDFENPTLLYLQNRNTPPNSYLHYAYTRLEKLKLDFPVLHQGKVYYIRNGAPGSDETDKLLAYCKYDEEKAMFIVCNLDHSTARRAFHPLRFLDIDPAGFYDFFVVFDSFTQLKASRGSLAPDRMHGKILLDNGLPLLIPPLCCAVIEMKPSSKNR